MGYQPIASGVADTIAPGFDPGCLADTKKGNALGMDHILVSFKNLSKLGLIF